MAGLWCWLLAALLYGAFWLWYVGIPRPLAAAEVDDFLARAQAALPETPPQQLAALRRFLARDDGREFLMLNLLRAHPEPVAPPDGGPARPAREVLEGYTGTFLPALLRRAGHPALFGRAAGGAVETWGVEADPGWTAAGVIRYRSRRDLMELVTDPRFAPAHAWKLAALSHTLAFPLAPATVFGGPRLAVGLGLALLAALAQLALRRAA